MHDPVLKPTIMRDAFESVEGEGNLMKKIRRVLKRKAGLIRHRRGWWFIRNKQK